MGMSAMDENDEMEVRVPVKAGLRQVVVTTVPIGRGQT